MEPPAKQPASPILSSHSPPVSPQNPRRDSPFEALRYRNFRLFYYGQTLSVAGTWMQTVAQNWLVWELTKDSRWLGIVNGANAIPFVLFAVWGGQLADRHSRRHILLLTQFLAMILAFVLAFLAYGFWIKVEGWHIALLGVLSGIVTAFNMPAQQAFISDMIEDPRHLGNAIALSSLRFNLARVLGPMLAGFIMAKTGVATCFLINALSFIAVITSLLMMRTPHVPKQGKKQSIREGFRYIIENKLVLRNVLLIASGALFAWSASTLYPVFAHTFGVGATGYSWLTSAAGLGAMTSGFMLAKYGESVPRRIRIYGGAMLFALSLILFTFTHTLAQGMILLVFVGFGMILCANTSNVAVQSEVPAQLRGRVMAVYSLAFQGIMPVGGLLAGYMAKRFGAPQTIRINAMFFLIIVCMLLVWSYQDSNTTGTSEGNTEDALRS